VFKNFILVVLFVFGLNNSAKADYIATYDWTFSAGAFGCSGGPGCLGFQGGYVYEVGTFTIDSPTDLLGPSGILNSSTPNYERTSLSLRLPAQLLNFRQLTRPLQILSSFNGLRRSSNLIL
jgi:hypothetical protein